MGHLYQRGTVWWIKYSRAGRAFYESSGSTKHAEGKRLLKLREGDSERGVPITPKVGRMRFDEAAEDFLTEYRVNRRRSYEHAQRRVSRSLKPWFQGRRMALITTADVQRYVEARQKGDAANATINRELSALKRMFCLAIKAGKLLHRPHIPMLEERNVRQGFFEREQFESVRAHLPADLRDLATFCYITGWRVRSEVLPLQWPQIDRAVGTIRLEPGTTKNQSGRTIAYAEIDELREVIDERWQAREVLQQRGVICPWVFNRDGRPIKSFRRSWITACRLAGCPGRVPHDFRRTAVRNLDRAGVGRKVAMSMVGHKTESVYRRYDIVTDADLHEAADKLNRSIKTVTKSVTMGRSGVSQPSRTFRVSS